MGTPLTAVPLPYRPHRWTKQHCRRSLPPAGRLAERHLHHHADRRVGSTCHPDDSTSGSQHPRHRTRVSKRRGTASRHESSSLRQHRRHATSLPIRTTRAHLSGLHRSTRYPHRPASQSSRPDRRPGARRSPGHSENQGTPAHQGLVARHGSLSGTEVQDLLWLPSRQPTISSTTCEVHSASRRTMATSCNRPPRSSTFWRNAASDRRLLQQILRGRHPPHYYIDRRHHSTANAFRSTRHPFQPQDRQRTTVHL